jgi:hypothetical protein
MNVLLLSKGPSARRISKSSAYKIACLNNAIVLCEEVDFFFCHDQDNIDIIDRKEWAKVKNFIMPYYPQKAHPGGFSADYTYEKWTKAVLEVNPECLFHFVALGVHDMNGLVCPANIPHMGETYSVLQTAATWLGMQGISDLITCGIDPEGGYHPMFEYKYLGERRTQKSVWTPESAKETERRLHSIASQYGYGVHRLNDDGTTTQQN